jgi:hypothetical protein
MSRDASRGRSNLGWVAILLGSIACVLSYRLTFDSMWNSVWNAIGIAGFLVATVMLIRNWLLANREERR